MTLVALVGMAGAGKSEVSSVFIKCGYTKIRFGDITEEEVNRRQLPLNEENERIIREGFRKEYGMAAFAILNLPKIDKAITEGCNVVIDGLYSWEEYGVLKEHYGADIKILAVITSPATRYMRLKTRTHRSLTAEQACSRDKSEIENINKGGPIVMADYAIINEETLEYLQYKTRQVIDILD
ncbi:MAG: AAA family ATPase [Chloroflexi bacterium]|nr:AAA family ATPase [Chloroflexota bacterium]